MLRGLESAHVESGVDRAADLLHSLAAADSPRTLALSASLGSELPSLALEPPQTSAMPTCAALACLKCQISHGVWPTHSLGAAHTSGCILLSSPGPGVAYV